MYRLVQLTLGVRQPNCRLEVGDVGDVGWEIWGGEGEKARGEKDAKRREERRYR